MFYLKAELAKIGTRVCLEKILHIFFFRTVFQVILGNFDFCSGWGKCHCQLMKIGETMSVCGTGGAHFKK